MNAFARALPALTITLGVPALSLPAQAMPAQAVDAQAVQAQMLSRQCPDLLTCHTAEVNLQDYWQLPLTILGQSSCAQFCSADYWISRSDTGAVLLQFGHGGPMGPALLAWSLSAGGPAAPAFELRTIEWLAAVRPQFIDDGWYEETAYTWDTAGEGLVRGRVRRLDPEERPHVIRELEDAGFRLLFHP